MDRERVTTAEWVALTDAERAARFVDFYASIDIVKEGKLPLNYAMSKLLAWKCGVPTPRGWDCIMEKPIY
jgi:hypothetical protein